MFGVVLRDAYRRSREKNNATSSTPASLGSYSGMCRTRTKPKPKTSVEPHGPVVTVWCLNPHAAVRSDPRCLHRSCNESLPNPVLLASRVTYKCATPPRRIPRSIVMDATPAIPWSCRRSLPSRGRNYIDAVVEREYDLWDQQLVATSSSPKAVIRSLQAK